MEPCKNWITSPRDAELSVYTYRKQLSPKKEIAHAVLHATAVGVYVPYLDGKRLGYGVLAPGWTSYRNRIQYQTYDITDALHANSVLSFGVGSGWAVGAIGWIDNRKYFSERTALWARLELTYTDGNTEIIVTDTTWEVYTSHVTFAELYNGETVDLTAPIALVGNAVPYEVHTKALIPQEGEQIVENERLAPVALIRTPKGETVIDFGQNLTGYVELHIKANKGDRTVIHFGEVLDKDGNFYNDNYRKARNEITYICDGGENVFKPLYSFQGFRYIKLVEYPFSEVDLSGFRAIAVHSELRRTGHFVCGNTKINQLYHNILWGQKSNYLDIPTDCPQRDERLGWTGDAQIFCRTAAINFDVERFFEKWLADVALEQRSDGAVFGIVPSVFYHDNPTLISAAWGDVACVAPWQMYLAYGNLDHLRRCFPMMKKWVDYIHATGPEEFLWLGGTHYGDWLGMDGDADSVYGATANDLIASAFFAHSADLVIRAGNALGEDVSTYRVLYKSIVSAFRAYFMKDGFPKAELPYTGPIESAGSDPFRRGMTQTALVLILHFNLCTEDERAPLAEALASMIKRNGTRMTTGFVGTPYLLHVLSDNGYTHLAYELLLQEKNPSWLYSVCHGATTMWEHWNSQKEDGSFWSTSMNSFNHYAYGAVFDWMFGVGAGIEPLESGAGYRNVRIAPHPSSALGFADASIDTRHGTVRSHWYFKKDIVYYEIEIPKGVTAYLTLPSGHTETLTGGRYHFAE